MQRQGVFGPDSVENRGVSACSDKVVVLPVVVPGLPGSFSVFDHQEFMVIEGCGSGADAGSLSQVSGLRCCMN